MMDVGVIRDLAGRHQTTTDNIVREYFQHLFLSHLYRQKESEHWLFKGGTALRIIWRSPRFSEDLDFTGVRTSVRSVESLLQKTIRSIEGEGLQVTVEEAKPTSGGYLAILQFGGGAYRGAIQLQISFRPAGQARGAMALISSEMVTPFTLMHLEETSLIQEKVQALLTRAKPRDFYDLYFILRSRLAFAEVFQHEQALKGRILEVVVNARLDAKGELKRFLPVNQHGLLKNFQSTLQTEVERAFPSSRGLQKGSKR